MSDEVKEYSAQAREAYQRKDWDAAEIFYTKAIKADPKNAKMYIFRGGVRSARAQSIKDKKYYLEALAAAVKDYRKAHRLDPNDGEAAVSLLEAEICSGRIRAAAADARKLWNKIQEESWKALCAWMGAVACALQGIPEKKWEHFRSALPGAAMSIGATSWNTGDIEKYLTDYAPARWPADRARQALDIHRSVVGGLTESGTPSGPAAVAAHLHDLLRDAASILAQKGGILPAGKREELGRALLAFDDVGKGVDTDLRGLWSEPRRVFQRIALTQGVRLANQAVEKAKGAEKSSAKAPYIESLDWLAAAARIDPEESQTKKNVPVGFANCAGFLAACMFDIPEAEKVLTRGRSIYPESGTLDEQSKQLALLRSATENAKMALNTVNLSHISSQHVEIPRFSAKVPSSAGQMRIPRDYVRPYSSAGSGLQLGYPSFSCGGLIAAVIIGGVVLWIVGSILFALFRCLAGLLQGQ